MKKSYLTLAAVAAIMASCSNEVLIDQVETPEVAIGFETFNNKATKADPKAENSSETGIEGLEGHHLTFSVWGYKDVQTAYVFGTSTTAGQKVEYKVWSGSTQTWNYTPVRFWDKNSNSYEFYAAAPETTTAPLWTLNANTAAQNDDYFTLSNVTLKDATLASTSFVESMKEDKKANDAAATHASSGNIDYMIASPKNVLNASYSQKVQLDFNHILSRLNITVKKGEKLNNVTPAADAKLELVSLEVCNMKNVGSFDESQANESSTPKLSEGTVARWATPTGSLTYTANKVTEVTTEVYVLQSLVMPQETAYDATVTRDGKYTNTKIDLNGNAAPYIKLVYKIGTDNTTTGTKAEEYTAYYNLASVFGKTSALAFNEGWQNTLKITIDADVIEFEPKVFNWEDADYNAAADKTAAEKEVK